MLQEIADCVFEFGNSVEELLAVFTRGGLFAVVVEGLASSLVSLALCDPIQGIVFAQVEVFVEVLEQPVASDKLREAIVVQLSNEGTQVGVAEVLGEDLRDESFKVNDDEAPGHGVPLDHIG